MDGAKSFTSYDEIYDEDWEIQEVCMIIGPLLPPPRVLPLEKCIYKAVLVAKLQI